VAATAASFGHPASKAGRAHAEVKATILERVKIGRIAFLSQDGRRHQYRVEQNAIVPLGYKFARDRRGGAAAGASGQAFDNRVDTPAAYGGNQIWNVAFGA
jgi:hypothetical protein